MENLHLLLFTLLCFAFALLSHGGAKVTALKTQDGSEEWGYVQVRPKAHMFWWLYRSPYRVEDPSKPWPIVLWLQGGPGASGVGIGNFEEVGPLDTNLKPRNSTWLRKADLLFVDNPVGTGFSFVEDSKFFVKTDEEAAIDLTTLLIEIFNKDESLQKSPLFLVAESYGGNIARKIKQQLEAGQFVDATNSWSELESVISSYSNDVDFYNFLLDSGSDTDSATLSAMKLGLSREIAMKRYSKYLTSRRANPGGNSDIDTLLNGVIRKKLKIIPQNITWGGQSEQVFESLEGDFMKPRINEVDELLAKGVNVTVYNGQVDLICATKGTEAWVRKLK
ncbi:serine carboxypeptidase-like 51 [Senna tora]|uniref:Carboxypeptidase n=1 Tax=Senna tora TaxID=362788 RepID=A0A834TSW8_9FABA|nr:serine carboxypeptidase-like 51 [Senna tora]